MKFKQGLIEAGAGLYDLVQKPAYAQYKPIWKTILAQWVLESGWGRSKLARLFKNFGGMKWRHGIGIGLELYPVYVYDWNEDGDKYFALRNTSDYPELYFDFIERKRYKHVIKTHEMMFLTTLASAGYVEKMPRRGGGIVEGEELPMYYANRIIEIKNGKRFQELLKQVLYEVKKEKTNTAPPWLNVSYHGAL